MFACYCCLPVFPKEVFSPMKVSPALSTAACMIQPPPILGKASAEAWHRRSADDALVHFDSTPAGLSAEEAIRRLVANGRNELKEGPGVSAWRILLAQFKSLVI